MTLTLKASKPVDTDWPDLIPLGHPRLPFINLDLLPGWAGDFTQALAQHTETPTELAAGMVLAACSTAVARRMQVEVKPGYTEPTNLWIVVALTPGNRKSSVQERASRPIANWEYKKAIDMENEIHTTESELETAKARIKEIRKKAAKADGDDYESLKKEVLDLESNLPEVPVSPRLWTSDATPEKLGSLMQLYGERMAWLSSEGGVFDQLQGRYSKGVLNLDLVLKSWSGDPDRVDRIGRPDILLTKPLLTIGLSPQPAALRGLNAIPGFRGRGLLARFLYLLPSSPLGFRTLETAPIPAEVSQSYDEGLQAMLDWHVSVDAIGREGLYTVYLTDDAYQEWLEFAHAIEKRMRPDGDLKDLTDWGGKACGSAIRIAGVLHGIKHAHANPWDAKITHETMSSALDIMAIITQHSMAAMELMGIDKDIDDAKYLWDWICRQRVTGFKERNAFNELRSRFPKMDHMQLAWGILEERGYIKIIEPPSPDGPGRPPSPSIHVRDELQKDW